MQTIRLRPGEPVRLDRDRLRELVARMGEPAAEEVICRAIHDIADRLAALERAEARGDRAGVVRGSRGIAAVASQIGMTGIAQVSRDVGFVAARGDGPALAATLARLLRIAERSLSAVWDGDLAG